LVINRSGSKTWRTATEEIAMEENKEQTQEVNRQKKHYFRRKWLEK
jgi:hypothetical protein